MDPKYLAEIKARERAATPGPWECETHHTRWGDVHEVLVNKCNPSTVSDCYFIAHARTDIPALVAEVERLNVIAEQRYQLYDGALNTIATLEKALGLACERIAEYAFCGGTDAMKQKHAKKNIQHFIQQAQEQEADHA